MDSVAAMLRGQIVDIVVGSVFLFFGFASCLIAVIRRRARVRIFVWLGIWSAMYGALRVSQSRAVIMALPRGLQIYMPYVTTVMLYLNVVPAVLAFVELTLGGLRVLLRIAAYIGLAIGITGILVFVVTGSNNALMLYNNLLGTGVLVILASALAAPRASSSTLPSTIAGRSSSARPPSPSKPCTPTWHAPSVSSGSQFWITSVSRLCCSRWPMWDWSWSSRTSVACWLLKTNLTSLATSKPRFFHREFRRHGICG